MAPHTPLCRPTARRRGRLTAAGCPHVEPRSTGVRAPGSVAGTIPKESVMTMASKNPTIVLVQGAWADAGGFDPEIRALRDRGFTAIGFANPLRDLVADATYLAEF